MATECEKRGHHAYAVITHECKKILRLTCPECGSVYLITEDELIEETIKVLTSKGYTDVERI